MKSGIPDLETIRAQLRKLGGEPLRSVRELRVLDQMFENLAPAAVLVPLTERNGELEVVLTKRNENLRSHPGEVSFPGGRAEEGDDDLVFTALREAHEEIALRPSDVDIYGALMRMPTVTGYEVSVYVGEFSQPYILNANPGEISTIIQTPLSDFADPRLYQRNEVEWSGHMFPIHSFDIQGHNVWGATALMLVTLIDYLMERE